MRFLSVLGIIAMLGFAAWRYLPPAWQPWAPLDIAADTTPVTWIKIRALGGNEALCRTALATAPFRAIPVPAGPPRAGSECSLIDAVRVESGAEQLSPSSFLATCPLAVDWAMFLVHVLQPASRQVYGAPVTAIHQLGSYNCRDIAGTDRLSAHATANAVDVASFQVSNGPDVAVADWDRPGKSGQFLHQLRDGACQYFGVVLSPDYNNAHAGHFHLQATGFGFCH